MSLSHAKSVEESVDTFVNRKGRQFARLARHFEWRCWVYSLGQLRRLRRQTARLAKSNPSQFDGAVLDLCCGTGGVTQELQRLFSTVVGVDLSKEMLSVAARRCPGARWIHSEVGLADISPYTFHACVIALGLHEMPSSMRQVLLERAVESLRPDGRIVVSDYAWPSLSWVRWFVQIFAPKLIEPDIVEFLDWPIETVMNKLGFHQVETIDRYLGILRLSVWMRKS